MKTYLIARQGIGAAAAIFALLPSSVATLAAQQPEPPRFDVNDVSFLWPVPTTPAEVDALIAMDHPSADGTLWPEDLFNEVIQMALKAEVRVDGIEKPSSITFEPALKQLHTWKVAGIRINPAAHGTSKAMTDVFGRIPGIRLIAQPVTVTPDGRVKVHDYAAHVVFNYLKPDTQGKVQKPFLPDDDKLAAIVADLVEIKKMAPTQGVLLKVHPGFKVENFQARLQEFLMEHLNRGSFQVVSFMGIKPPEPWIFFSALRGPATSFGIRPVGGFPPPQQEGDKPVLAQMFILQPGAARKVSPAPQMNPDTGIGLSTALLFQPDISGKLDTLLAPGSKNPLLAQAKLRDVPDIIANPAFHNTATTDCVSCHTDHSRKEELGIKENSQFFFKLPPGISDVDPKMLPKRSLKTPSSSLPSWNVRNFGWFPDFFDGGRTVPTISRRAANEAAESAAFLNEWVKGRALPDPNAGQ